LAGLQFSAEAANTALIIKVTGYNDKLPVLTTKMLGELRSFIPTAERFASVKDQVGSLVPSCPS
jgi:secreted Zn-dependent insulinase-like peptidase